MESHESNDRRVLGTLLRLYRHPQHPRRGYLDVGILHALLSNLSEPSFEASLERLRERGLIHRLYTPARVSLSTHALSIAERMMGPADIGYQGAHETGDCGVNF